MTNVRLLLCLTLITLAAGCEGGAGSSGALQPPAPYDGPRTKPDILRIPPPEARTEGARPMGAVLAVEGDLAAISAGRAHGVRKGMLLAVTRGELFVAWLRIERADRAEAAGILVLKNFQPMPGDSVVHVPRPDVSSRP